MGHSEYDPGAKDRRPWNADRKYWRQADADTKGTFLRVNAAARMSTGRRNVMVTAPAIVRMTIE
jgi:hypothetical protein